MSKATFHVGDVVERLREYPDNFFDAVLCDPPYGLTSKRPGGRSEKTKGAVLKGFMGLGWDSGVPDAVCWGEVQRVCKPGAYLLSFGGTRTFHRLACAVEDAGWSIVDCMMFLYGTGFPKSHSIGKAIDKKQGNERKVVGVKPGHEDFVNRQTSGHITALQNTGGGGFGRPWMESEEARNNYHMKTAPGSEDSARWEGYGTALKPAYEPIIVAMKPVEGTYADNALTHGVAGFNIDGSRIEAKDSQLEEKYRSVRGTGKRNNLVYGSDNRDRDEGRIEPHNAGRWPTNVILQHHHECKKVGTRRVKGDKRSPSPEKTNGKRQSGFANIGADKGDAKPNARVYGDDVVEVWDCHQDCPVRLLDEQSGERPGCKSPSSAKPTSIYRPEQGNYQSQGPIYPDTGGASRFFYHAKVAKKERNKGCEKLRWVREKDQLLFVKPELEEAAKREGVRVHEGNLHPTLKPLDLCRYLATLILPPERETPRRLLVPFSGAASEVIASILAGWDEVVGVELDPSHNLIAAMRYKAHCPSHEMSLDRSRVPLWSPGEDSND
jgi:site-specific DNA-methyltransferase (adenine-specific)